MSYEVVKTYPIEKVEGSESTQILLKLDKKHASILFRENDIIFTDYFRYESGWVNVSDINPDFGKVQVTRLLASCKEGHDHGVYYQSPNMLELWEVMFSIGEVNTAPEKGL
jgi:hypothetical protein